MPGAGRAFRGADGALLPFCRKTDSDPRASRGYSTWKSSRALSRRRCQRAPHLPGYPPPAGYLRSLFRPRQPAGDGNALVFGVFFVFFF